MRIRLIIPQVSFGSEEGKRLSALLGVVHRACELAGCQLLVERDPAARPAAPAGWSGQFRTGDEINTVTVVEGRIVRVA